jgi:hypothetical protein
VIAVAQDEAPIGLHDIEEVGAIPDHQPDNARQRTAGIVAVDLAGIEQHGILKTKVGRLRPEQETLRAGPAHLNRRLGAIERKAEPKQGLGRRRAAELRL